MQTSLKKIILGLSFTCSALITTRCVNHKNDDKVSDDIVLKIGKVAISEYEVKLNYDLAKQSNSSGEINYEQWLESFLDKTYFLADAFEKRYDTISAINKVINYAAQEMIGCVDGYLWNKEVTPTLKIKKSELKEAYKKRNKVFYIEYVKFNTKKEFVNAFNKDTFINDVLYFNKIVSKIKQQKTPGSYYNQACLWPFDNLNFLEESIYNMKDDQVNNFFTPTGIYVVHIKTEPIKQLSFKKEKENIAGILMNIKKMNIAEKKQAEIFKKANIVIDQKIVKAILEKHYLRDSVLCEKNTTLMTYFIKGKKIVFKIKDFYDFHENAPFFNNTEDQEALIKNLKDYVIEKYLFVEAEKTGVTRNKKYLLEKNNYFNRLMRLYYENEEFRKKIKLTEDDLNSYYDQHKTNYMEGKVSYVSVFTFKDINAAFGNWDFIKSQIARSDLRSFSDTSVIKGLLSYIPNVKIEKDNKTYSSQIVNAIQTNNIDVMMEPINFNGNGIIFYKTKEEGKTIRLFDEVKPAIQEQLDKEKMEQLKSIRLKELKWKYPVAINKITRKMLKI